MTTSKRIMYIAAAAVLLLLIVFIDFLVSRSGGTAPEEPTEAVQATAAPTQGPVPTVRPTPVPTPVPTPEPTPEPTEEIPVITPPASSDDPASGTDIVLTTARPASGTDLPDNGG